MRHTPSTLLSLLTLAACGGVTDDQPDPSIGLSTFSSCAEMEEHLTESFLHSMTAYAYAMTDDIALDSGAAEGGGDSAPSSYSTTNVQEKGVDEADLVKTDGEYVYVLNDDVLSIVRSWPAESAKVVGEILIKPISGDGSAVEKMFLSGDRILVYTGEWSDRGGDWRSQTGVSIIDISNREAPVMVDRKLLDGSLVSARMIGTDVYTVLNNSIRLPTEVYEDIDKLPWMMFEDVYDIPWDAPAVDRLAARERLQEIFRPFVAKHVSDAGARSFLPTITHEDGDTEAMLGCTDVLHSKDPSEAGLTTVAHVDLASDKIGVSTESTGVLAGSTTVYASKQNLYIAQTSYGWWDGISDLELETRIHRLALDGADSRYESTGSVDGFLHNQFSMSEHEGLLRVATTYEDWRWGTSSEDRKVGNNIFILDAQQPQMGRIGELTGLAPGEQIYATRFQGDRAFMVTFVQVDPLFTIDLRYPTAPVAVGELKIPGYSSYLHPIGKDHVLGIGMEGTWDGWITGLAISLFDVSNFADPKQQDQLTLECDGSSSEALWDHHAVLVYGDTVAIPAYGYSYSWGSETGDGMDEEATDGEYRETSGLIVADIDTETGLTQRGFVDHRPLVEAIYCPDSDDCSDTSYMPRMRRSLVIEDYLFSISELGVMVSSMEDPEVPLAAVPLL
jgi:uncharacterized secreted protein with C-terminal beta-propeller domain